MTSNMRLVINFTLVCYGMMSWVTSSGRVLNCPLLEHEYHEISPTPSSHRLIYHNNALYNTQQIYNGSLLRAESHLQAEYEKKLPKSNFDVNCLASSFFSEKSSTILMPVQTCVATRNITKLYNSMI